MKHSKFSITNTKIPGFDFSSHLRNFKSVNRQNSISSHFFNILAFLFKLNRGLQWQKKWNFVVFHVWITSKVPILYWRSTSYLHLLTLFMLYIVLSMEKIIQTWTFYTLSFPSYIWLLKGVYSSGCWEAENIL